MPSTLRARLRRPHRSRSTVPCLVVVLALLATLTACATQDDGPRSAVQTFLDRFADRDFSGAGAVTTDPDRARDQLAQTWTGLAADSMSATAGRVRIDQDVADVPVTYTWTLAGGRSWEYSANIALGRGDTGWSVRWKSSAIHPKLGADQRLAMSQTSPPRAAVNESDGSEVMVDGTVVGVSFDAAKAAAGGSVSDSAHRLVDVLGPLIPGLDPQAIAEKSTARSDPLPIGRIQTADFDRLRDRLAVPGIVTEDQAVLVPRDPGFAPSVLAKVKDEVSGGLTGASGWRVSVLNPNGLVADVVADESGTPAPAVLLTLSRSVQDAAQRAVNAVQGKQAMLVALQASTGKILAIAQNRDADRDGLIATSGLYPPGSTFKMVTSAAAFHDKMTDPDAIVPCPGEIHIGERSIPNYDGFSLGAVPLRSAFAHSCNTTFADLASRMGPTDLTHAAAAMGLGEVYRVPGLDVKSGSVPVEPGLVARSEDGFGQGRVLASPLGMALVAAAAATGRAQVPQLIDGRETTVTGPQAALSDEVYQRLRPMMRAVVTEGTATSIAGSGEVYGKTGEAEVAGGSHAWFAGYRGDIAFATLIVLGGDSTNSVNVTRDFLDAIPAGYRP
ncbi:MULTISPECIES: penicillin-binding transpeptidase domain-containing protein [Gordonia]|uniref:penicillin-binding transpeptidase domain-containing protein n=1 Tax=Gordonia TaxID=2053 RepID=UPI0009DB3338|nr:MULTISPECIES: penicillin-binding transpeptidase domain-containing protein [Gordonia]AUH70383.1 penicillin-binding protein [Gordonia sp. YC-JH1]